MKKLLSIGVLTLCALALSEHQAQAWVNSRFSIGLNWHLQSANTSYLWGLWRNGQIPGPEGYGPPPGGIPPGTPGLYGPPQGGPQPFPFMGAGMQPNGAPQQNVQQGAYNQYMPYGYQPTMYPYGYPAMPPQMLSPYMTENATPMPQYYNPNMAWYGNGNNLYRPASYQQASYGYYQPNYYYYYPAYGNDVPYYWYGGR
jgi:hypothetical protein